MKIIVLLQNLEILSIRYHRCIVESILPVCWSEWKTWILILISSDLVQTTASYVISLISQPATSLFDGKQSRCTREVAS